MTETTTTENTAVAVLSSLKLPEPARVSEEMSAAFASMYARLEEQIAELDPDMTVKANREAARSLAYDIAKTKKRLEETANGTTEEMRLIVKAVTAERGKMAEEFDRLRDKARAALTAWEDREKELTAKAQNIVAHFNEVQRGAAAMTFAVLSAEVDAIETEFYGEHFGAERIAYIEEERTKALANLRPLAERKKQEEEERAELERLRAEKAERDRQEAERIAAEEKARQEKEEEERRQRERDRMEQEAKERAEREAKEAIERERREKEEAERRAEQAEKDRIAAEERAEQQRQEAAERAEREAKEREERAAKQERERIEAEERRKAEEERARAADTAHRASINNAAADALLNEVDDMTLVQCKAIVVAIAQGRIPGVKISY
jgi:colicin import membrane protein